MMKWIYGINPVYEALRSGRCQIGEVWLAKGRSPRGLEGIASEAKSKGISIRWVERFRLDSLTKSAPHQGVVSFLDRFDYATLDDILQRGEGKPLLLILDGIADPRNLGALIRSADACGVWGVIIPKARAAGITPVVAKSSAGAVFHVPVVRVANIPNTLRKIKNSGVWVIGATAEARQEIYHQDLNIPLALVIGGEGRGMRPLVKRECDLLVSIPMKGKINSLNVSVAGAVILYEVLRQRRKP
ncbi:MAG: 23S rRNA (guanosine(2251)-2'-O)-methyltransferase RlmB [Deltaproteobacteria bacterium]|nr:MAG: 23S rRNA (guanosine(2251)-2'-O)-methyltransferase RlmB [Deltaproteobacteria bacterium]